MREVRLVYVVQRYSTILGGYWLSDWPCVTRKDALAVVSIHRTMYPHIETFITEEEVHA